MPARFDLLAEFFRLVVALTEKPPPHRGPLDWEWPEEDDRERDARVARQAEEDRAMREEQRRKREAEDRQLRAAVAQQRHDQSAIGQASEAAWRSYLGSPEARLAYADYGFDVAGPGTNGERFTEVERLYANFFKGGRQRVVSADRGDCLTAFTQDGESGLRGWVTFRWQDADGWEAPPVDTWMRLRDPQGRLIAVALNRFVGMGRPMEFEGVIDRAGLLNLSRFINGHDGGWIEFTEPGEQVVLLALRPGGLAVYEEARRLFRARWEAAQV